MTAQEQQMLRGLTDRINQTQLADKDTDAEQFIHQTLGRNPDALYVMAQTVLVQQYALDQAQGQIGDLRVKLDQARQHAQEPKHATSFLGNLLGHHDDTSRMSAPPPPPPAQTQYASANYGPGLAYPSGGYPLPGAPQGGGFLRSAMQTATGVAAGALAFEGIESLMHGFGHVAGYGSEFGGAGLGAAGISGRPEEIVNNYYGDASTREHSVAAGIDDQRDLASDRHADSSLLGNAADTSNSERLQDTSDVRDGDDQQGNNDGNADDLSGTEGTDYSADGDDSMLADDVGDQGSDSGDDGGDSGGGDSSNF